MNARIECIAVYPTANENYGMVCNTILPGTMKNVILEKNKQGISAISGRRYPKWIISISQAFDQRTAPRAAQRHFGGVH